MAIKKDTDKVTEKKNEMNITDNMNGEERADEKLEAGGRVVRMADAKGFFEMLPKELQGIAVKVKPGQSVKEAIEERLKEYNKNKK